MTYFKFFIFCIFFTLNHGFPNKIESTVESHIVDEQAFVSIRVFDKQIQSQVRVIQKSLLAVDPRFSSTLVPLSFLHLTFSFFNISNENFQQAKKALNISAESYVWHFGNLNLTFQGVKTFNNDDLLVFSPAAESVEKLDTFYKIMVEAFKENGLSPSKNLNFSPHVVIAALKNPEDSELKKKWKIFEDSDYLLGSQKIENLDLCSQTVNPITGYFDILAESVFN